MTTKTATSFKTIPDGTAVTWHHRSATGHGTVSGVQTFGTTADNTIYLIVGQDHHRGEPDTVPRFGKTLTCAPRQKSTVRRPVVVKIIAM